ncbi:MAG: hypothetical protein NC912_04280 [Candidatus Omnitrophica bacterium]|nr:hypothetical protein [Candidatus Omnitrophota bacterium]
MNAIINSAIIVALVSLVLGIISRVTMFRLPLAPGGIGASAFLEFTNTCLLVAITFILLKISKK